MTSTIIYPHTPYVYIIRHMPSGKFYAGSRTAKGCHPSDLWTKYFTSSKYVKDLIIENGYDSFQTLMIFECNTRNEALDLETSLLKSVMAAKSISWLNRTNGDGKYSRAGIKVSKETIEKMRAKTKGVKRGPVSDQHRQAMSISKKGVKRKPLTAQHCQAISDGNKGKVQSAEHCKAISIAIQNRPKRVCPHCNVQCETGSFTRWHGDNCRFRKL